MGKIKSHVYQSADGDDDNSAFEGRGEVWDVQVAVYNGHVPTNIGHCLQF